MEENIVLFLLNIDLSVVGSYLIRKGSEETSILTGILIQNQLLYTRYTPYKLKA